MKKECELCVLPARMYCESDGASLCTSCDLKIHSANFLVAKHTRTLLCQTCQAPTPWKASGADLGSSLTVCCTCIARNSQVREAEDDEQSGSSDDCGASEETDNQVVPSSQLNPSSASSSDEQSSSNRFVGLLKRVRDDAQDEDDELCSTSSSCEEKGPKAPRMEEELILLGESEKESDVLVSSLRKFHKDFNTCSAILHRHGTPVDN